MLTWTGAGVAAAASVALVVFWKARGLEQAGWLAGVVGALAALAALALTLAELSRTRRTSAGSPDPAPPGPEAAPPAGDDGQATDAGGRPASSGGDGTTINTVSGGTIHGPLIMARDLHGQVRLGSAPPPNPSPPDGPSDETTPGA